MSDIKRWVIGDVHGCVKSLKALVEEKIQPGRQDKIIFVGDYIDRGPDSKGVISYIMNMRLMGYNLVLLKGNHEDMMLRSRTDKQVKKDWFYNGGLPTLQSFGAREVQEVPEHFLEFLESTEYYHMMDDFLVVHAGLNFEIPDPMQDTIGMLWIRNTYVSPEKIGNRTLVHGHTPTVLDKIKESIDKGAKDIDLDGGCVYAGTEGLGNLCALELNTMRLEVQPNIEFGGFG
jgi:serine/threonine protein phosphatase 1